MGARNTAIRDKHRRIIAKDKPPCGICGGEIDYNAPQYHPLEFTVDHIVPVALGGADVLENKQAAHRHCNRQAGAKPKGDCTPPATVTRVTKRDWWS